MRGRVHTPNIPPITFDIKQKSFYSLKNKNHAKEQHWQGWKPSVGKCRKWETRCCYARRLQHLPHERSRNRRRADFRPRRKPACKRERPREFERLSKDNEVLIADGNVINAKGEETQTPLGEYVMRPISYVAALVTGDRNSISITALQSAVRNKYDDAKVKGKTVVKMSAPTPGDFVAQYGEQLINTDIVLLDYQEKKSGRYTTKICLFGAKEEKK